MTLQKEDTLGKKIVKAAGILLLINLLSRVLGFVRNAVIAAEFGATGPTDAYMVAYSLPYALQAVLGVAFLAVIVPIITAYLVKDDVAEAWKVANIIFNWTFVVLIGITALGMLLAPQIIAILAGGFDEETTKLAIDLTRIIFPSIIFMGAGMLVTGILNARGIFGIPAFAPAFANIIVIIAVLTLAGQYGVHGLVAGTVVAFMGFLLIQLPLLKKTGFKWKWDWDRTHPAVITAGATIFPLILAISINQIHLAVNRVFASGLEEGSITVLDLAYSLMALPLGVFVAAIATIIFPAFSRCAASDDKEGLAKTLVMGIALVSLIAIPAAAGLMVIREPLIQLAFERGAFDAYDTARTAVALWYFSLGLWAVGVNTIAARAYYAFRNIRIPLIAGLICAVLNVLFSIALLPHLGHGGLALANSLASIVNAIILLVVFRKYLPDLDFTQLMIPFVKAVVAAGAMAIALTTAMPFVRGFLSNAGFFGLVMELAIIVSLGCVIFIGMLFILKTKELDLIKKMIKRG